MIDFYYGGIFVGGILVRRDLGQERDFGQEGCWPGEVFWSGGILAGVIFEEGFLAEGFWSGGILEEVFWLEGIENITTYPGSMKLKM